MYRGKSRNKFSQDNRCLRPHRTEHCPLLLELNDSASATESYRTTTQTMFRTLGFATRVQKLRNCEDILYFIYCHWRKCNALRSLLRPVFLCLGWEVPSNAIRQSPGFEWLGTGRGTLQRQNRLWRMAFGVFPAPEGAIRALTSKITVPRLR